MSSFYGAQFMLRDILQKMGVMQAMLPTPSERQDETMLVAAAGAVWRCLPLAVRKRLAPLRALHAPRNPTSSDEPRLGIDPAKSKCFPLSNGLGIGGIRLNLVGREPAGTVHPGDDEERFVAQLSNDLLNLVDERTGGALVRRVLRTRDLYDGPNLGDLPDLLVEWNDETPTGSTRVGQGRAARVVARSAKLGRVERENSYARTGEHRIEGMFVAVGPQLSAGELTRCVSVLDFAPTFCEFLGVKLPVAEGSSIFELIKNTDGL